MRWSTICLCSFWHLQVAAFNLDTENVLRKSGDPGSLFGFSVAFHQQRKPARRNLWVQHILACLGIPRHVSSLEVILFYRLLVGAPRAKHQNQVNVTGVVYQCDLATTSERCQPIEFDNEGKLWAIYLCNVNTQRCSEASCWFILYYSSSKYMLCNLQSCHHFCGQFVLFCFFYITIFWN